MKKTARFMWFLFLCIFFHAANGQTTVDTLTMVHISDTHICNLTGYQSYFEERREHYGSGQEPLHRFLETIPKQQKADAVILTGDIIDFYEAQTTSGQFLGGQVEQFASLYELCPVPFFMTLGNHDISSYWVEDSTDIEYTQVYAQRARAAWIRNIACFKNGTYYAKRYKIGRRSYRFIFLDDGYYLQNDKMGNLWDKQQLDWLNTQLSMQQNEVKVLFMHICIPVGDTNGDGNTFTSLPEDWPPMETYEGGIMKILNTYPSIAAIFVGHNHKNVIEDIPFPGGHTITQIETGAFGRDPNNWRKIQFTENGINISSPGGSTIEERINISNQ